MRPITTFNNWILTKVTQYLKLAEGCDIKLTEYTSEGARTVLQDSFGFTYEINIRTLGRSHITPLAVESKPLLERIK